MSLDLGDPATSNPAYAVGMALAIAFEPVQPADSPLLKRIRWPVIADVQLLYGRPGRPKAPLFQGAHGVFGRP